MSHLDTKERILDAAEGLFARRGFHSTSLRAITGEARANLAAVNYHFGSKDALIEAVFARRLGPLNEERAAGLGAVLEAAEAEGRPPVLEDVLRAFIAPTLRFRQTAAGAREFALLVGRAIFEPEEGVRRLFFGLMGPVFKLFFGGICASLPDMERERLFWKLQFAMGAMGRALCMPEKPDLAPAGIGEPPRGEEAERMLVGFLAGALRAP